MDARNLSFAEIKKHRREIMKTMRITQYSNATSAKTKNRRVSVQRSSDGDGFNVEFLVVDGDTHPRAFHNLERDKMVVTTVGITNESAMALLVCLLDELKRCGMADGAIKLLNKKQ